MSAATERVIHRGRAHTRDPLGHPLVQVLRGLRAQWPWMGEGSRLRSVVTPDGLGPSSPAAPRGSAGDSRWRVVHCWDSSQPMLGWVIPEPKQAPPSQAARVRRRCGRIARDLGYGGVDICYVGPCLADDDATFANSTSAVLSALRALAQARDLIVLAWGPAVDGDSSAAAVRLLRQELSCHAGSLAVLGWTPGGQPIDVGDVGDTPALSCLCCGSGAAYDHDARFDRLVMGVTA